MWVLNFFLNCKEKKTLKINFFFNYFYGIGEKKLLSEKAKLKPLSYSQSKKLKLKLLIKMKKLTFQLRF